MNQVLDGFITLSSLPFLVATDIYHHVKTTIATDAEMSF